MTAFDARILRDVGDWTMNRVRLAVREARGNHVAYLMESGLWQEVEEGVSPEGIGLILPAGSIEPIAVAIAEFQGHTSHAETEARVLREWLTVERARVDAALVR